MVGLYRNDLEGVEGMGWLKIRRSEYVNRVLDKYKQAFNDGEFWEDTYPLIGKDWKEHWFISRARPIKNMSGMVV